ncbi:DUF4139 domain-containing protein [Caenispirillum salinarum]|uniref:DUF4139 domain-containing protein n=1 Tax=Caenispirillum salinarum TaxID=859058 RepID=UPI00384E161F
MPTVSRSLAAALLVATALVPAAHAQDPVTAPEAAREALSLTLYNSGSALVADRRAVAVPAGESRLVIQGLPSAAEPASAFLRAEGLAVRSQTVEATPPTAQALLAASVGREIGVAVIDPDTGAATDTLRARVLSAPPAAVYEIDGRIHTSLPGQPVFDALPNGVHLTPVWSGAVTATAPVEAVTLSYLTGGLSWDAGYVATLSADGGALDLEGRATIRNDSGAAFIGAEVALVAGDVARAPDTMQKGGGPRAMMAMAESAPARMDDAAREQLGAFHLYMLEGAVGLPAGAVVQPALLTAQDVPVETEYRIEGGHVIVHGRQAEEQPVPVETRLTFENAPEAGLGKPLPAGTVRVFRPDASGTPRLVGADRVEHMAEGREVSLTLGRAFDVTAERVQTEFERLSERVTRSSHRITLRNARDEAVTVRVVESIPGDWTMVEQTQPHEKETASRAAWEVEVPAKGEAVLGYTIRTEF